MHESWTRFTRAIDGVVAIYGGSIYDERCGKHWDAGQAVCAEAYGPDWMSDDRFIEDDQSSDTEPVPSEAWSALSRLLNRESDWAKPAEAGDCNPA